MEDRRVGVGAHVIKRAQSATLPGLESQTNRERHMLEFDDIQHILLTRAPALTGRYEFLSFREAAGGRKWLAAILETVQSAAPMRASVDKHNRWVTVAFTWNGLRALGVDDASLRHISRRVQAGNGRPCPDARRHRRQPPRSLGRKTSQPRLARDRDSVRPRRSGKATVQSEHEKLVAAVRVSKCSRAGLERDATI